MKTLPQINQTISTRFERQLMQLSFHIQASHFDLRDGIPTRYHAAKFPHERKKLRWQFGKYFFNISAVCYGVIEVHNNLFTVRKFPASKVFQPLTTKWCKANFHSFLSTVNFLFV